MREVLGGKQCDRITKTTRSHVWTERDGFHFLSRLPGVCGSRGRLLSSLGTQKQKAAAFSRDARELLKERKLKSSCWQKKKITDSCVCLKVSDYQALRRLFFLSFEYLGMEPGLRRVDGCRGRDG